MDAPVGSMKRSTCCTNHSAARRLDGVSMPVGVVFAAEDRQVGQRASGLGHGVLHDGGERPASSDLSRLGELVVWYFVSAPLQVTNRGDADLGDDRPDVEQPLHAIGAGDAYPHPSVGHRPDDLASVGLVPCLAGDSLLVASRR